MPRLRGSSIPDRSIPKRKIQGLEDIPPEDGADTGSTTVALVDGLPVGGALRGTLPNPLLATNAATTDVIVNGAITSIKLASGAVTAAKLVSGAVGLDKINPTGAADGEFIGFNGTTVVWGTPTAGVTTSGSLSEGTIPVAAGSNSIMDGSLVESAGLVTTPSTLHGGSDTGSNNGIEGETATGTAVAGNSYGSGTAVGGSNHGSTGKGGVFTITNVANGDDALKCETAGGGNAIFCNGPMRLNSPGAAAERIPTSKDTGGRLQYRYPRLVQTRRAWDGNSFTHVVGTLTSGNLIPGTSLVAEFAGTGAGVTQVAGQQTAAGILQLSTGTTNTGRAAIRSALNAQLFGGMEIAFAGRVYLPLLATATEDFVLFCGHLSSVTTHSNNGAYLCHQRTTDATHWVTYTRNNGASTSTTTTVTITTAAWTEWLVLVDSTGGTVYYYQDGTLITSHTANIPTAAGRECGYGIAIVKSAGTTARTILVDAYDYYAGV